MSNPAAPAAASSRRDFLNVASGAFGAVAAGCATWPLIDQMNPSADVQALATVDIDLTGLEPGNSRTVLWRGAPVFVRYRTPEEIEQAAQDDSADLPDPATDASRAQDPRFLVLVGVCTHLGCIPIGDGQGEYQGWFCPCHGSHYDTSGRIRKGPAPKNLAVPPYRFVDDTTIRVG